MASGWSRESTKTSTLDYERWTTLDGQPVYVQEELQHERMMDAIEQAGREIDAEPAAALLPFQEEPWYQIPIEAGRAATSDAMQARVQLVASGVGTKALMDAEKAGFVDFVRGKDGADAVFLGRDNLSANGHVVNVIAQDGRRTDGPLRDEFPPVLHGDDPTPTRVVIAPTGADALAVWTKADSAGEPRPTVIVADDPTQLHPRTARLLEQAERIEVVASPQAGPVAEKAREFSPKADVRATNEQPAKEAAAAAAAAAEQARPSSEHFRWSSILGAIASAAFVFSSGTFFFASSWNCAMESFITDAS